MTMPTISAPRQAWRAAAPYADQWMDPRVIAASVGLVLLLGIWAAAATLIRTDRSAVEQKAAELTNELVQTYEAQVLRAFREIDHTLRIVQYVHDAEGGGEALDTLGDRDLLPPTVVFEVSITDASGVVVASTKSALGRNVSQANYFAGARGTDDLIISQPRRDAAGTMQLLFSRRLQRAGEFSGIVFVAVDAAYFVSSYDPLKMGASGMQMLVGTDGIVRARRIGDGVSSGGRIDWAEAQSYSEEGLAGALRTTQWDNVPRFTSMRRLRTFSMGVMVGLSRQEQLAIIAARTRQQLWIAAFGSLLVVVVATALTRMRLKLERSRCREQQSRIRIARESGMAEIATNVLHNVGNALNSVNVCATLVAESMRESKVTGLARAVALMKEHDGQLGEFLTQDPRGKHLPMYLYQLSETLQTERDACATHLDSMRGSVDHIKAIVKMQQSLATASCMKEEVDLTDLMESGLQMNVDSLGRHSVNVVRDFDPGPPVVVDKHRVLQVLVNLISNAKHACKDTERQDKSITLRLRRDADALHLSVADNGVGIAQENLARIFQHGFTTRRTGHGFGLHSSALTAKEMGGSLHVHSDGVGQGAIFTLTLPLKAAAVMS